MLVTGLVTGLVAGPVGGPASAAEPAPGVAAGPVRVMIVGDSLAQGSAGDWTWRYRLWEHLRAVGADVDLVGPYDDLYDNVAGTQGSTAYADPAFDRDHAARWGTGLDDPGPSVADLVAAYRPDVVVESRGLNDLMWQDASAPSLLDAVSAEVGAARGVDPDVDLVLARLPPLWWDGRTGGGIGAYNDGLAALAGALDASGSRVVATAGGDFEERADTWDGAHLSARGEVRMAAHVADALAAVGVGAAYPRPLPAPANGHWGAATLAGRARAGGAELSWASAPGVTQERLWWRDRTRRGPWRLLRTVPASGSGLRVDGLRGGHVHALRLQAVKGAVAAEGFSPVVEVVPRVRPGRPTVRARARAGMVRLRWSAPVRATSYVVAHRAGSGWRVTGRRSARELTARHLGPGLHRWRVRAVDGRLLGPWSRVVRVRVR